MALLKNSGPYFCEAAYKAGHLRPLGRQRQLQEALGRMSSGDEWIIYLGGFRTNLPFLLSKSNHNGIHIGLMHRYHDSKAQPGCWGFREGVFGGICTGKIGGKKRKTESKAFGAF